jgi:hypothetical protein
MGRPGGDAGIGRVKRERDAATSLRARRIPGSRLATPGPSFRTPGLAPCPAKTSRQSPPQSVKSLHEPHAGPSTGAKRFLCLL